MADSPSAVASPLDPGGDPQQLHDQGEHWRALSAYLEAQSARFAHLMAESQSSLAGVTADTLERHLRSLTEETSATAQVVSEIGQRQQEQAGQQAIWQEILIMISIQIAATVALIWLGTFVPGLLAAIQARLALLAAQANWAMKIFIDLLSAMVRFLVRARSWLNAFSKLSWRGEQMSVAYGRFLYEGGRDFVVELIANPIATAVQNKPIDAADLFRSAGVSFLVGGVIGGVEGSGVKKLLAADGVVLRGADGKPQFASVGDQYASLVMPSRTRPDAPPHRLAPDVEDARVPARQATPERPVTPPGRPITPHEQSITAQVRPGAAQEQLARAQAEARRLDVGTSAADGRRLADDAAGARRDYDRVVARDEAEDAVRTAEARLDRHTRELSTARVDRWGAETNHSLAKTSGDQPWIQQTERDLNLTQARERTAANSHAEAQAVHTQAVQHRDAAVRLAPDVPTEIAKQEVERTAARYQAWAEVAEAARVVRGEGSLPGQLADSWHHNAWRDGYPTQFGADPKHPTAWQQEDLAGLQQVPLKGMGEPKSIREILLQDGVKDFVKGASTNSINSGIEAAQGRRNPGDIWKDALLGGATSAARGVLKGAASEQLFPKTSIEEILWRSGTKSADKFTRDQLRPLIETQPVAGSGVA